MYTFWERLAALRPPTDHEHQVAATLVAEYRTRGYLRRTCRELLAQPDGVIIAFYAELARADLPGWQPPPDSGWMAAADFCFVNVRATGLDAAPGNLIQAAKLLPALRVNAIHLAPFTDYDFHVIYAVRSVQTISPRVVHPGLPLTPEDQLRAFVEAAHQLGMAVGFDLEPHVAQFAITVIMRPELFRWLKLAPDFSGLAWNLNNNEMLEEVHQVRITNEIHELVAQTLRDEGLDDLEAAEGDDAETRAHKQAIYFALIGALIERGYWTIPSQSWNADGLPAYAGYNHEQGYARFDYRGRSGEDLHDQAFHILTPYKFYTGLRTNQRPLAPAVFAPAREYFAAIFARWRDNFGFDFLRYDYADHIFDSVDDDYRPTSDRPAPDIWHYCIERSRTAEKPYIGNLAERMDTDLDAYAELGFDLMLGDDMLAPLDVRLVERSLNLHDQLVTLNADRPTRFAATFAVDTHDTGNPGIWGEPLVKVAGAAGMRARHFLARFTSVGRGRRPKYEVMGSQDLSYGLYESNTSEKNLVWVGDETYNRGYHLLEDVYARYRPALADGSLIRRHVQPEYAWWLIALADGWLLPVIAFAPQAFSIHLADVLAGNETVTAYDFATMSERTDPLTAPIIEVPALVVPAVRLWFIERRN